MSTVKKNNLDHTKMRMQPGGSWMVLSSTTQVVSKVIWKVWRY